MKIVTSHRFLMLRALASAAFLIVWRGGLWALSTTLLLLRPVVAIVLVPAAVLLFFIALIFGFWAKLPHFFEPRWTMIGCSLAAIAFVQSFDGLIRFLDSLRTDHERHYV